MIRLYTENRFRFKEIIHQDYRALGFKYRNLSSGWPDQRGWNGRCERFGG